MRGLARRIALVGALASLVLAGACVGIAFAEPTQLAPSELGRPQAPDQTQPSSSTIERKKAEKTAVLAELERMRAELAAQVDKYVSTGRRIQAAEQEVVEVNKEIAEQDGSLTRAEQALVDRAVELYRSDRVGMMELLFTSDSLPELLDRMSYLMAAGRHDRQLIDQVKMERQESLWLQQSLNERVQLLSELQVSADEQRSRIESDIAQQQEKAISIGEDIARLLRTQAISAAVGGSAPQGEFSPDTLISQQQFQDVGSMDVAMVQAFLNDQPGSLKLYRGPDHSGVAKSAAEMIVDAAVAWNVSPKVVLATLQKEQSLLSRAYPEQRALDWAMGCGATDSGRISKYAGFGNQIWYGAKSLSTNAARWKSGIQLKIDGSPVMPSNPGTYGLYKYTPHIRGNVSFWMIFWRYFGDPLAVPGVVRP